MKSPRIEALAFRIWAYASAREWDCQIAEIADALGVHQMSVTNTCRQRNWLGRLRAPVGGRNADYGTSAMLLLSADSTLDGGSYAHAFRAAGIPERGACIE